LFACKPPFSFPKNCDDVGSVKQSELSHNGKWSDYVIDQRRAGMYPFCGMEKGMCLLHVQVSSSNQGSIDQTGGANGGLNPLPEAGRGRSNWRSNFYFKG
jgi:hypothetical protein